MRGRLARRHTWGGAKAAAAAPARMTGPSTADRTPTGTNGRELSAGIMLT